MRVICRLFLATVCIVWPFRCAQARVGDTASSEKEEEKYGIDGSVSGTVSHDDALIANVDPSFSHRRLKSFFVSNGTCASNGFSAIDADILACQFAADWFLPNLLGKPVRGIESEVPPNIVDGCSFTTPSGHSQVKVFYKEASKLAKSPGECKESRPCICTERFDPIPVCGGGMFEPDPNKYYTISSATKYMSMTMDNADQYYLYDSRRIKERLSRNPSTYGYGYDIKEALYAGSASLPIRYGSMKYGASLPVRYGKEKYKSAYSSSFMGKDDLSDASAHWRFIKDPVTGDWYIRNRLTALEWGIASASYRDAPYAYGMTSAAYSPVRGILPVPFELSCNTDKSRVFIGHKTDEGEEHFARVSKGSGLGTGLHLSAQGIPKDKHSKCVKKKRSCRSMYGQEYFKTKRELCGFGFTHKLRCRKINPPPVYRQLRGEWAIQEVEEFVRRGEEPDPAAVTVNLADKWRPEVVSDAIAFGGKLAAAGITTAVQVACPLCGALTLTTIAFGFGFLGPEEPDMVEILEEALNTLAEDILERTSKLIATGIAEALVELAQNSMMARREFYLLEYPGLKHRDIQRGDLRRIEDRANELLSKVDDYGVDISTYFGSDFEPTELNAKRGHIGFELLKLATTEALAMDQEAILLKAYADPSLKCDDLIADRRLRETAEKYKNLLQGTFNMLLEHRLHHQCCREQGNNVFDDNKPNTLIFTGNTKMRKDMLEAYRAELEHDMRFLSYPMQAQLDYFGRYGDETLAMCNALRTDPNFRAQFVTDIPGAGTTTTSTTATSEYYDIWEKHEGAACRTNKGELGAQGQDYSLHRHVENLDECRGECEKRGDSCRGFEYSEGRCEVWRTYYGAVGDKRGFTCYWKRPEGEAATSVETMTFATTAPGDATTTAA